MLAWRYPSLPLALVHKVLAFYLENQPEVDAYVVSCRSALDSQQQESPELDWNVLCRRWGNQTSHTPEAHAG